MAPSRRRRIFPTLESRAMAEGSANGLQADVGVSPKLQGLDSNPEGHFGPLLWQAFRDNVTPLYAVSLPDPSEEGRFSLSTRAYATPRGILRHCRGTALTMTRGPEQITRGADQLLIYLQIEGSVDQDY